MAKKAVPKATKSEPKRGAEMPLTMQELIDIYNKYSSKPVSGFDDLAAGVKQVRALLNRKGMVLTQSGKVAKKRIRLREETTLVLHTAVGATGINGRIIEHFRTETSVGRGLAALQEDFTKNPPPRSSLFKDDPMTYLKQYLSWCVSQGWLKVVSQPDETGA